jgi:hypothetical protein
MYLAPLPDAALLADKWRVREHVGCVLGDGVLNEIFCAVPRPEKIDFDALPNQFALKMNNACGRNIFIRDKRTLDIPEVVSQLHRWLDQPYGIWSHELYYPQIPPMILVERFLFGPDGTSVPTDYKFFVYHGRCEYIRLDRGRFADHTRRFYDRNWTPQSFAKGLPLGPPAERPPQLEAMIEMAEALARGRDFLRIDLYLLPGGKIVFGEITQTDGAGSSRFTPVSADFLMGTFW